MKRVICIGIVAIILICYFSVFALAIDCTYTGTFEIPCIGLQVQFTQEQDSSKWQAVVDKKNLALIIKNLSKDCLIVADHSNQSFSELKSISVGDGAVLNMSDNTVTYLKCCEVISGTNCGTDIVTSDNRYVVRGHIGDVVCYTCDRTKENPDGVLIVVFNECDASEIILSKAYTEVIDNDDNDTVTENEISAKTELINTEIRDVVGIGKIDYSIVNEKISEFLIKWFIELY